MKKDTNLESGAGGGQMERERTSSDEKSFTIKLPPPPKWDMAPTGDYFALTFRLPTAPNAIHRFLQRLILGIRYKRRGE